MPTPPDVWYYADHGGQLGPLSLQELKDTLATLPNPEDVLVWASHLPHWKRAGEVPELTAISVMPPLPPREQAPKLTDPKQYISHRVWAIGLIAFPLLLVMGIGGVILGEGVKNDLRKAIPACEIEVDRSAPAYQLNLSFEGDQNSRKEHEYFERRKQRDNEYSRGYLMVRCMAARGFDYAEDCLNYDATPLEHKVCLAVEFRIESFKAQREQDEYCLDETAGKYYSRKTEERCYVPFSTVYEIGLGLTRKLNGHLSARDYWCSAILHHFSVAVHHLRGDDWTWVAGPLMPGEKCANWASYLDDGSRKRLQMLIRKEKNLPSEPLDG
ncbi:DUF4339 domain-containing protein [Bradyrhizobium sp. USDA 4463]